MAIQADFHLHSNFSGDSSAPMEDMIQKAISLGLTHICITEHYDPDYIYLAGQDAIFELNTDSYLYELLRLRERYKDKISVGFGVELGLQPHLKRELAVFSKSKEFDFIIGSSHLCNRKDPYYPEFFEGRSEEEAHREYFETVLACIQKLPYFDVYGHLDYVVRYGPGKDKNYSYEKYEDILDPILRWLAENGKGIEINTGAIPHGLRELNPCTGIIKRYRALGGEIITVGSDAHAPQRIAEGFDRAADILRACGCQYYTVFSSRRPRQIKL